jgi:hypothetical protein
VQTARELGMNPTKALPEFIERLYFKRFGRERPDVVVSIEERARQLRQKKTDRKAGRHSDAHVTRELPP